MKVSQFVFIFRLHCFRYHLTFETLLLTLVKLKVSLSHMCYGGYVTDNRDSPTYLHITGRLTEFFTARDKQRGQLVSNLHVFLLQDGGLLGEDLIGLDTLQALLPLLLLQRKGLLTLY